MRVIETERFLLKELENIYISNVFEILSDKDVISNLNMIIHERIEDTEKLFQEYKEGYQKKEKYPFEILDKNTLDFIGVFLIKLDLYDEDCFEFTIYLNKKYWNQGVYSEVLPFMCEFAFHDIGTLHFRGFVMEKNSASRRVLEKCGFQLEKIFLVDGIEGNIYSYLLEKE